MTSLPDRPMCRFCDDFSFDPAVLCAPVRGSGCGGDRLAARTADGLAAAVVRERGGAAADSYILPACVCVA
ncbi:hypothetical protein FRAAL1780 [Frankia alni ACN14a]|uniref:Uncharacterized protein n=1 Tax=Frankia alni (strain DSM 45986 / CECT 9034 / ACN14a) TaxID=326424 RepID=Q0RPU7_FRAAA|nr:hypothetical protein FRAAL1780 [Frankia alni ACN14a]